jgi:hypothetical protein
MLDSFSRTREWDEPGPDEDFEIMPASWRSIVERVEATRIHDTALAERIERGQTAEELILSARVLLSSEIADRLDDILEPEDIEMEGETDTYQPKLLTTAVRSFLAFCLRASGTLDQRFIPGRTYSGELGVQFLDPELGDLSIRFLNDGRALVAFVADSGQGSCQCLANDLLTERDPFVVSRWL